MHMAAAAHDNDGCLSAVQRQMTFAREVLVPSDAVFKALHGVGCGGYGTDTRHFKGPVQDATAKRLRGMLAAEMEGGAHASQVAPAAPAFRLADLAALRDRMQRHSPGTCHDKVSQCALVGWVSASPVLANGAERNVPEDGLVLRDGTACVRLVLPLKHRVSSLLHALVLVRAGTWTQTQAQEHHVQVQEQRNSRCAVDAEIELHEPPVMLLVAPFWRLLDDNTRSGRGSGGDGGTGSGTAGTVATPLSTHACSIRMDLLHILHVRQTPASLHRQPDGMPCQNLGHSGAAFVDELENVAREEDGAKVKGRGRRQGGERSRDRTKGGKSVHMHVCGRVEAVSPILRVANAPPMFFVELSDARPSSAEEPDVRAWLVFQGPEHMCWQPFLRVGEVYAITRLKLTKLANTDKLLRLPSLRDSSSSPAAGHTEEWVEGGDDAVVLRASCRAQNHNKFVHCTCVSEAVASLKRSVVLSMQDDNLASHVPEEGQHEKEDDEEAATGKNSKEEEQELQHRRDARQAGGDELQDKQATASVGTGSVIDYTGTVTRTVWDGGAMGAGDEGGIFELDGTGTEQDDECRPLLLLLAGQPRSAIVACGLRPGCRVAVRSGALVLGTTSIDGGYGVRALFAGPRTQVEVLALPPRTDGAIGGDVSLRKIQPPHYCPLRLSHMLPCELIWIADLRRALQRVRVSGTSQPHLQAMAQATRSEVTSGAAIRGIAKPPAATLPTLRALVHLLGMQDGKGGLRHGGNVHSAFFRGNAYARVVCAATLPSSAVALFPSVSDVRRWAEQRHAGVGVRGWCSSRRHIDGNDACSVGMLALLGGCAQGGLLQLRDSTGAMPVFAPDARPEHVQLRPVASAAPHLWLLRGVELVVEALSASVSGVALSTSRVLRTHARLRLPLSHRSPILCGMTPSAQCLSAGALGIAQGQAPRASDLAVYVTHIFPSVAREQHNTTSIGCALSQRIIGLLVPTDEAAGWNGCSAAWRADVRGEAKAMRPHRVELVFRSGDGGTEGAQELHGALPTMRVGQTYLIGGTICIESAAAMPPPPSSQVPKPWQTWCRCKHGSTSAFSSALEQCYCGTAATSTGGVGFAVPELPWAEVNQRLSRQSGHLLHDVAAVRRLCEERWHLALPRTERCATHAAVAPSYPAMLLRLLVPATARITHVSFRSVLDGDELRFPNGDAFGLCYFGATPLLPADAAALTATSLPAAECITVSAGVLMRMAVARAAHHHTEALPVLEVRHLLDADIRLVRRASPVDGSVVWKSDWSWSRGYLVSVRGVVVRKELRAWGRDESHGHAFAVDRLGDALGAVGTGLSPNTQLFLRLRDCAAHDYIDVYMDLHKYGWPVGLVPGAILTLRHVLWKQADRSKRAFYLAFAACTAIEIAAQPDSAPQREVFVSHAPKQSKTLDRRSRHLHDLLLGRCARGAHCTCTAIDNATSSSGAYGTACSMRTVLHQRSSVRLICTLVALPHVEIRPQCAACGSQLRVRLSATSRSEARRHTGKRKRSLGGTESGSDGSNDSLADIEGGGIVAAAGELACDGGCDRSICRATCSAMCEVDDGTGQAMLFVDDATVMWRVLGIDERLAQRFEQLAARSGRLLFKQHVPADTAFDRACRDGRLRSPEPFTAHALRAGDSTARPFLAELKVDGARVRTTKLPKLHLKLVGIESVHYMEECQQLLSQVQSGFNAQH